ncbi:hypothetical protein HYFRA_00007842 [Hymenoscyphus fraxineus]|uniref:C2H2-type domain-containing protein n=1 Tax=Hymenoscyphus fraxineus TaxID=746836 RepID=A0A9N9PEW0_9HELO|nr:hypothetical protein HYFRA_00007842 [Hymenoscyphus fraxineus]
MKIPSRGLKESKSVPATMSVSKSIPAFSVVEPITKALKSAIMDADVETLRVAMFQLCERGESTSVSSTLEKWLVPKKGLNELIALKGDKEGSSSKPIDIPSSPKAHSPQLATCEHCDEDFDLLDNEEEVCVRHTEPKYANMDSDVWDDHDEDCHGDPDDLVDEPDYAGGFLYGCCERPDTDKGCTKTKHNAAEVTYSYRPTAGVKRRLSIQGPEPKVIRLR